MVGCPALATTSMVQDALHLAAPALQPMAWVLEAVGGGHQSRYLEVRVRATSSSTTVTEMMLRRTEVRVVGEAGQVLEQSTMEAKVARCLAELVACSPPCLRVRVRRPEVAARLSVTLLGTNVQGSPLALHSAEEASSTSGETYGPDSTCGILELADLEDTNLQEKVAAPAPAPAPLHLHLHLPQALQWEPTSPAPPPAAAHLATRSSSSLEDQGTPSILLDQLLEQLEDQGSQGSLALTLLGTNVECSPLAIHRDKSPSSPARLVTTLNEVNVTSFDFDDKTLLSVYSQFTVSDVNSP